MENQKNPTHPNLIIFDMDGTMLDTEPIYRKALIYAGNQLGVEIKLEVAESLMGKSTPRCCDILRAAYGEDFDLDKLFSARNKYMREYLEKHGVPCKKGLFEILDRLDELGVAKCVATSTSRKRATERLSSAGILHRFQAIICGDEVANGKPSPDIFLKAAQTCGFVPADCVVIEDTEAGANAAYSAGIRLILVPDLAPLDEKTRALAFAVCADLIEVADLLL
ncbi:MAG: HAD family phosphatase [Defluviitaleaceae bacterium]|nr:HAD family phosphatase [Defluviitaleaceae bacterium]